MYEILRKLNQITKLAPYIGWNNGGSSGGGVSPESGFSFDTTGMINGSGRAIIIIMGDSMGGTTGIRPWQSGFIPQHPTPINDALYEFVTGVGIQEVTAELSGSMADVYPSNSQSMWPKWGNDFFTTTGIKPIFLKCNVGGAEICWSTAGGDVNNWEESPVGENFDLMTDAWELAKVEAGVTKPLLIHWILGINDAAILNGLATAQQVLSYARIKIATESLITRLKSYFGADVQIRITTPGSDNNVSAYTGVIGVRQIVRDAIKTSGYTDVQLAVSMDQYFNDGHYSQQPGDNTTGPLDGIHLHQSGNNQWADDANNFEVIPRFDINVLEDRFPNYTSVASTSATLNFKCLVNYKLAPTATVYWAVYPVADAVHTKVEIAAGTDAIAFGTKETDCNVDDTISLTGLSNNVRYRVHYYIEIDTIESEAARTQTSFYTRASGNAPETNTMLARYSALDATWISNYTLFYEDLLNFGIEEAFDDIWHCGHNSTADKYISMMGIINPVNLGTGPAFVANSGLRTTIVTGDNRLNLQVNDFDFPNYLSTDGFYALSCWDDQNGISSGTLRAIFGNVQSTNRSTRFGVTYNSASSKFITFAISRNGSTTDCSLGSNNLALNKLHIVSKVATESTTLDADVMVDGFNLQTIASPDATVANTVDWYMFCQNNNGAISARSAMGVNFLAVGKASLLERDYLTLACKRLGIGV